MAGSGGRSSRDLADADLGPLEGSLTWGVQTSEANLKECDRWRPEQRSTLTKKIIVKQKQEATASKTQ